MPETISSPFRIYKSSAGSGKTSALVRIFLGLILKSGNPNHFQRVLAITFTNKATGEMKGRLLQELQALATGTWEEGQVPYMVKDVLRDTGLTLEELRNNAQKTFTRMLFDYGDLSISTIDRFNHKLIRAFSRELQLRSDFQVELDMGNLFSEAVMRLVERVGHDPAITQHLTEYILQQQEDDKRARITTSLQDLQPLVMDEDALQALNSLDALEPAYFAELTDKLKKANADFEAQVRENALGALHALESAGAAPNDVHGKSTGWYGTFVKLAKFPKAQFNITDSMRKALEKDWAHPKAPAGIKASIAAIDAQLTEFAEKEIALFDQEFPLYLLRKETSKRLHLVAILKDLRTELAAVCEERNILPIAYFNRMVSESLREEPVAFIYENLGSRYDHILIDEFQDTSEMQWLNLLPLVDESIAKGKASLVVGDAKQSIYRWRGGKAEQLIRLPDVESATLPVDPLVRENLKRAHEVVALNTNYRSSERVIEFNNQVFAALKGGMTQPESLYMKEYDGVAQQIPTSASGRGYVEVNALGKNAPKEAHHHVTLHQIRDALDRGYHPGDMCILVRSSRKEGNALAAYLMEHGITVSTSDSRSIDQDPAVRFVIAMLRLHLDPNHNPAKLQAMRFLAQSQGLPFEPWTYLVKNENGRFARIDFNRYLRDTGHSPVQKSWYGGGAMHACESLLRTYAPHALHLPAVVTLLDDIQGKGGQRITVADYLTKWDEMKSKPSAGTAEGQDSVKMMTIHKAKGLQFKVCILPLINWKLSLGTDINWVEVDDMVDGNLPYIPVKQAAAMAKMGLSGTYEREEASIAFDNLNMLYVAFTRAVDELYINYTHTKKGFIGANLHEAMEQIRPALSSLPHVRVEEGRFDGMEFGEDGLEDTWQLCSGEKLHLGKTAEKTNEDTPEEAKAEGLPLAQPPSHTWSERFPFAYDPKQSGPDVSRRMGILFHRLAAETDSLAHAQTWIEAGWGKAELDETEAEALQKLAVALFGDKRYVALRQNGVVLAERELVHHGEVIRPDLVVENGGLLTVVDFKTGGEKEAHRKQVLGYASALKAATGIDTKAALLYLDPLRWTDVG